MYKEGFYLNHPNLGLETKDIENTSKTIKAAFKNNYAIKIYRKPGDAKRLINTSNMNNRWFRRFFSRYFDKGSVEETGYHRTNGMVMVATEVNINDWQRVSVFSALDNGRVHYEDNKGDARMKLFVIGMNMSHESLRNEINYGISISASKYKDNRNIVRKSISKLAKSTHYSGDVNLYTNYGRKFEYRNLLITLKVLLEVYNYIIRAIKKEKHKC